MNETNEWPPKRDLKEFIGRRARVRGKYQKCKTLSVEGKIFLQVRHLDDLSIKHYHHELLIILKTKRRGPELGDLEYR